MKGLMQHRKSFVEMSGDALDNDNAASGISDVNLVDGGNESRIYAHLPCVVKNRCLADRSQ